MRRLILAWLLLTLCGMPALGQSSPGLTTRQVPTAAQWNSYFAAKQDVLGFVPLNAAGGTMSGRLITTASTSPGSGLRVPEGTAPTSPADGDVWMTTAGLFYRSNGATVGPLVDAGGSGVDSVENSDGTLTVSPTSGNVVASLNLGNANTWSAAQTFAPTGLLVEGSTSGTLSLRWSRNKRGIKSHHDR